MSDAAFNLWSLLVNIAMFLVAGGALLYARQEVGQAKLRDEREKAASIEASQQAVRDSREQTRPYVSAQLLPSVLGPAAFDLVVRNTGRSMARDLRLECDWPDEMNDHAKRLKEFCEEPRDLAPGASLRVTWREVALKGERAFDDGFLYQGQEEVVPLVIRYGSDDPGVGEYSETVRIDTRMGKAMFAAFRGMNAPGVTGRNERDVVNKLEAIALHLGELRRELS